ncbi:MAG: NAD(P)H-hydrate epimerase [Phycisphaeraceae bacterium]
MKDTPTQPPAALLSRDQSRRVDQLAIERLGIPGVVLMENAGINATDIAAGVLEAVGGNKAAIVCGGGNNGGDGLVIARHLRNAGRTVVVYLAADPATLKGDAKINFDICQHMGVKLMRVDDAQSLAEQSPHWSSADVLIDALLGTGFEASRGLRPHAAAVIEAMNNASAPRRAGGDGPLVLAVDVPSGLDCDSGQASEPTVIADATATFVARKRGFEAEPARAYLGEVFVAGIGVPPSLVDEVQRDI